jgi:hypothetical protein
MSWSIIIYERTRRITSIIYTIGFVCFLLAGFSAIKDCAASDSGRIRPYEKNESFWQYKGEPVMLIGGNQDWCRDGKAGQQRFWRTIFAGHAAVRFHRPSTGIGISEEALCQIRSVRLLIDRVDFFTMIPSNELIGRREANEAYCLADRSSELALYFPAHGDISLNAPEGEYEMSRLCLQTGMWNSLGTVQLPGGVMTDTNDSHILLLVRK